MAKIGLNNFQYGKLSELANGSFSYTDVRSPGKAVSCNVSVTNNSATLYADDELAESYTGYQNATISIAIDEEDNETYSDLLGHTINDNGEVVANTNDLAPFIGFGYIITKMVNGVIKYKVQFLHKVKFTEPSKEENTKGESIEFGTYTLEGGVYTLSDGRWTKEKTFENKEDALEYLNRQLSEFEKTDENDYIYDNGTILYYIGTSKRPEIPPTLGGVTVSAVERTAFGGTDVEAVKFPNGMEVIE